MAAVVTKFRIRSTCAVRVTQARHPVVRVCRQVSHNSSQKKKISTKYQNFFFFESHLPFLCVCVCVWAICVSSSCRSIDCVRLLCLVDPIACPFQNFVTLFFCRDANAFCPPTLGLLESIIGHTLTHTHTRKNVYMYT